jgi:hypothetical protein
MNYADSQWQGKNDGGKGKGEWLALTDVIL